MLKKYILYTLAIVTLAACSRYDDSFIWDKLISHEYRIQQLEKQCQEMNKNISSIRTILNALQQNDYVTGLTKITEDGVELGYIINFSNSGPVTIYHGKKGSDGADGEHGSPGHDGNDGKDGHNPLISAQMDEDGKYYWTLDGEWLIDEDGNKVPVAGKDGHDGIQGPDGEDGLPGQDGTDAEDGADGADGVDGITPQLKIEEEYWYISYDNGVSWTKLDKALGENGANATSFFKGIDVSNENYIILILANDQEIRVPTWKAFEELETLVNNINDDLSALHVLVAVLQSNDYITMIVPITVNGEVVGYTLHFSKNGQVDIYHGRDGKDGVDGKDGEDGIDGEDGKDGVDGAPGKDGDDGKDGHTPSISVRRDSDGKYYWTLDGEWILDPNGAKIPATGSDGKDGVDGVVPMLKVENGYWYISYDGGLTWSEESLGQSYESQSENVFSDINYDADYLYITLKNAEVIKLPRGNQNVFPGIIDQVRIENGTAIIKGKMNISKEDFSYAQVTLHYSEDKTFNVHSATAVVTYDYDSEGRFTLTASGLNVGSTYQYCICIKVKSKKFYSSVAEFVVTHPYSEPRNYDAHTAVDLSSAGTANCYIISQTGLYKFRATQGNSSNSISNVAIAEIVWESFGTDETPDYFALVEGVCYKDGYVVLKIADEFKEGNALVSVKDAEGNILWSWHIWMTDAPDGQVYYNDAGTVMDRNLGATTTTPGDGGAFGLFYQWGRKDPFLGAATLSSSTFAKSTITWPAAVPTNSITGTMEYANANPTTNIEGDRDNYDWFFTDGIVVDTTRWAVSTAPKSIYDPCPVGWRVPEGGSTGVWAVALDIKYSDAYTFDSTNKGMQMGGLLGEDSNIWYPAAGNLDYAKGTLMRLGTAGVCWTVTNYTTTQYRAMCIYWTSGGRFYVNDHGNRARAFNVRCIKEQ